MNFLRSMSAILTPPVIARTRETTQVNDSSGNSSQDNENGTHDDTYDDNNDGQTRVNNHQQKNIPVSDDDELDVELVGSELSICCGNIDESELDTPRDTSNSPFPLTSPSSCSPSSSVPLASSTSSSDDEWCADWNAVKHDVVKMKYWSHLPMVVGETVDGEITDVNLEKKIVVINNEKIVGYDRCVYGTPEIKDKVRIGELRVQDVVNARVVTIDATSGDCSSPSPDETVITPIRCKCFIGKITDDSNIRNNFVFCDMAFITKTAETDHLFVGLVVKCLVIESTNERYHWRAIVLPHDYVPQEDPTEKHMKQLLNDKENIFISAKLDFGAMQLGQSSRMSVTIKNTGSSPKSLMSITNEPGETQIEIEVTDVLKSLPYVIPAGHDVKVILSCTAKYRGDSTQLITFQFDGFAIGRYAQVTVIHHHNLQSHHANGYFNSTRNNPNRSKSINNPHSMKKTAKYRDLFYCDETWLVREKVFAGTKHIHDKMLNYSVPRKMWSIVEKTSKHDLTPLLNEYPILIASPLHMNNYEEKMKTLLYLEEIQCQLNIRKYDLQGATFTPDGEYLKLQVKGLAEGRPSLVVGDKLLVIKESDLELQSGRTDDSKRKTNKDKGNDSDKEKMEMYEGFIHHLKQNQVCLKFAPSFHSNFDGKHSVYFQMSRSLIRRCHSVLEMSCYLGSQVLFPTNPILKKPLKRVAFNSMNWFNQSLNNRQKLAVVNVLRGESRPTPYLIFGPPGTGKTVTIVESILQVFTQINHSRIIACTASNSSADLIASKLLASGVVTENDIIRISPFHRINSSCIPTDLIAITKTAEEDQRKWLFYRIIITTTCTSGVIYRHKVSPNHFTHVFIDEAVEMIEPESLIPIALAAIGKGCVVLAGDPKQLGPVVQSPYANQFGLDKSFMERLMLFPAYQRDLAYKQFGSYNPKFITKLIDNYRSDSFIMTLSSRLFYDSELLFHVKPDTSLLTSLKMSQSILFHSIAGVDQRDADSPSWFNYAEVIAVETKLRALFSSGVSVTDIGIITPYRKQVEMIKGHLRKRNFPQCNVATIEEFQGNERRVIIVSMVRSSESNLAHDRKFNLGFVCSPKRFNVALSRAMVCLIVIGNAQLLARDEHWGKLIQYCVDNACIEGQIPAWVVKSEKEDENEKLEKKNERSN